MFPVCFVLLSATADFYHFLKDLTEILFYFFGKITEICPNFYHMKLKLVYVLLSAQFFLPFHSSGQMIDSMMKVYAERYPQEKVYMQFDKKAYNPGERIWYKAFVFSGFDPSPYSKNFYAEIYDANGNLILRNISPIFKSCANGSFDLPVNFCRNTYSYKSLYQLDA